MQDNVILLGYKTPREGYWKCVKEEGSQEGKGYRTSISRTCLNLETVLNIQNDIE